MSASVREMVRRGDARADGRVGSAAQVGEERVKPAPALPTGCLVLCMPKGKEPMRGTVVLHHDSTLLLDTPSGRVWYNDCPRARIFRLDQARRDGAGLINRVRTKTSP